MKVQEWAPSRKHKTLVINELDFLDAISGQLQITGLPDDATLMGANYDFERQAFIIRVFSEAFDLIPFGERPPEVLATYTERDSDEHL